MANDIFIKIGTIKGESVDAKHKDEIELVSWSWGVDQIGSAPTGSGGGSGRAEVREIFITKHIDAASAPLLLACLTGEHITTAVLSVRRVGKGNVEFLKITMTDVLVRSVSMSTSAGDIGVEAVGITFNTVTFSYTPQSATGKAQPAITVGWDVVKQQKL